jgi:hypothetical protein
MFGKPIRAMISGGLSIGHAGLVIRCLLERRLSRWICREPTPQQGDDFLLDLRIVQQTQ